MNNIENNAAQNWRPPEDYILVASRVPGVIVYAPKPKEKVEDKAKSYTCPKCGANIAYNVAAGGVACEYCGYTAPVMAKRIGKAADEFEFTLETLSQSTRGWGTQRQILQCESCGAQLSIPDGMLTATCPFCASNQVNVTTSTEESLRPRFLVPFKISTQQTRNITVEWLGKGWLHPNELAANTVMQRLSGIYLPFWTFDTRVTADWRAEVGYEETNRHYNSSTKSWETRTTIKWRWEQGRIQQTVDDFLVPGSHPNHISHGILHQINSFDLKDLVAYQPDYLAGWQAQAYETTLTQAWGSAKLTIRENAKKACHQDIPSHHVRNFSMTADFADESWRYILLPVYIATYKFEGKVYQMMINGQTGKIAGQKPVAWWKVWLMIAGMLSPGLFLGLIGMPLLILAGAGVILVGFGIILFIIGVVLSILLYNKARQSEAK
jgi:DNA-directed RNA polymerase subunit RPC12/RpoP